VKDFIHIRLRIITASFKRMRCNHISCTRTCMKSFFICSFFEELSLTFVISWFPQTDICVNRQFHEVLSILNDFSCRRHVLFGTLRSWHRQFYEPKMRKHFSFQRNYLFFTFIQYQYAMCPQSCNRTYSEQTNV
jgi:hypothetical protein